MPVPETAATRHASVALATAAGPPAELRPGVGDPR